MPQKDRDIVRKRIKMLYNLAIMEIKNNNIEMSSRYIYLMLKLKRKYRANIPKHIRRSYCKKCFVPLIPGKTLDIRIRNGKIIYRCKRCNNIRRFKIKNT